MENKDMRVAVYIRVGNKEQINEQKNAQKGLIEDYFRTRKGSIITNYYIDEGYSGLNFKRPMLQKMIKDIEQENIDIIAVSDYSRISRNIQDIIYLVEKHLIPKNIKLISIRDNNDFYSMQKDIYLKIFLDRKRARRKHNVR